MGKGTPLNTTSVCDAYLKIQFVVHRPIDWFFWFRQSFLGSSLGLFLIVPTHMFFWSWHFVLVFSFCRQCCLCVAMQTKVCPSNTAWSSCWAEPGCGGLWTWLKGWAILCTWQDLHQGPFCGLSTRGPQPPVMFPLVHAHPNLFVLLLLKLPPHSRHVRAFSTAW